MITEHLPLTVQITSASSFAAGLVFGNPLHEEILSRDGDADEVCGALAAAIDRELGGEMPLQALVIQASKD